MKALELSLRKGFNFWITSVRNQNNKATAVKTVALDINEEVIPLQNAYTGNFFAGAHCIFHPLLFRKKGTKSITVLKGSQVG